MNTFDVSTFLRASQVRDLLDNELNIIKEISEFPKNIRNKPINYIRNVHL